MAEKQNVRERGRRTRCLLLMRGFNSIAHTLSQLSDTFDNALQRYKEMNPRKKAEESKNLAISMATKAASFARELKWIRSDLCFMQEQCALLEEENRRLRD
ncbi:hypothetical protein ACFX11_008060 [Malus domestica]